MGHKNNFRLAIHETFIGDHMQGIHRGAVSSELGAVMVGAALVPDIVASDAVLKIEELFDIKLRTLNTNQLDRVSVLGIHTSSVEHLVSEAQRFVGAVKEKSLNKDKKLPGWLNLILEGLETCSKRAQETVAPIKDLRRDVLEEQIRKQRLMTQEQIHKEAWEREKQAGRRAAGI